MGDAEPQGCLAAILRMVGIRLGGQPRVEQELPYRLRDDFLSPAELSFYGVLKLALRDQAVVCAKVNLADLFFVARPNDNRSAKNRIDRKHVDFLVCHSETMKPLVGLELDDKSHQRAKRIERDQFVEAVFEAAGLPLIRVAARASYDPKSIAAELAPHLNTEPVVSPRTAAPSNPSGAPVCPKCEVPMVQRMASKGRNAGQNFWGCANYPRCREIA